MKTHPTSLRTEERQTETQPTFLYIVSHGTDKYYLCDYDSDVEVSALPAAKGSDPQTFTSAQVRHTRIEQSLERVSPEIVMSIAVQQTAESSELRAWFLSAISEQITLEIIRVNSSLLPGAVVFTDDCYTVYHGIGTNVGFNDYTIAVNFTSLLAFANTSVPRFAYQKTCQHRLGSSVGCTVDLEVAAHRLITTVSAVNRANKTIDIADTQLNAVDIDEKTFELGEMKEMDGATIVNRIMILACEVLPASAGTRLRLAWVPPSLIVTRDVRLYRGCDKTVGVAGCAAFGNLANFGGMPYIPKSNPGVDGFET